MTRTSTRPGGAPAPRIALGALLLLTACASDDDSRRAELAAREAERARDSALRAEDEAWGHAAGAAVAGETAGLPSGAPPKRTAKPSKPAVRPPAPKADWPEPPEPPPPDELDHDDPVDEPPPVIYGYERPIPPPEPEPEPPPDDDPPAIYGKDINPPALPAPPQVDHRPLAHGDVPLLVSLSYAPPRLDGAIHVDERRAKHGADGSQERPFPTIGAALELAEEGSLVLVAPAEYEESVTLPAGVTLRGRRMGGRVPVLHGTVTLADRTRLVDVEVTHRAETARGVVGRGVTGVLLRGVTVRDVAESGDRGTACGIDLVGCREVTIEGCVVRDLTERMWGGVAGIRLVACQAKLWGNWVLGVHEEDWDSAYGVLAVGCDLTISGLVVADVRESDWADAFGLRLVDCWGVVTHTTVVGVSADDFWGTSAAISIDATSLVTLERSIVAHAAKGIANGSKGSIVRGNVSWNAICEGPRGDDHLDVDPGFVDDAYRVDPASPAATRGAWAGAPEPPAAWAPPSKVLARALQRVPELERQASLRPD